MKYSQGIGIAAAISLVASCFLNWAWYPDLQQHFTGFYSYQNYYGRRGIFFSVMASLAVLFYIIPRLWAKRINLLVTAINLAYAVFTFITFTRCYGPAICPEKRFGLFLLCASALVMMIMALLPDLSVEKIKARSNRDTHS
jgi:uncharacterized membrane protein YfhO